MGGLLHSVTTDATLPQDDTQGGAMRLRVIRDADTVEFEADGGKLVLLKTPRKKDVEASEELEQKEAKEQLAILVEAGVDPAEIMKNATQDDVERAQKRNAAAPASAAVRALRLRCLAVRLVVDGEAFGKEAIINAYQDMDVASAAWVDERVKEVWDGAKVSDEEREGAGADAPVPCE